MVGSNNQLAHAASLAVAESPAEVYNPLFIYGGVGLGKTHLMHSVAHYVLNNNPSAKVLYVTSEVFTNELIEAIRNRSDTSSIQEFRKKYRNIDNHRSEQVGIDRSVLQEVMERTYLLLLRLIPNISLDFKILDKQEYSNRRDIHTLRMDALEQLENVFGSSFLVHLEKENYKLYDDLQSTERTFLEKTGKELDMIYSLLQNVFFDSSK